VFRPIIDLAIYTEDRLNLSYLQIVPDPVFEIDPYVADPASHKR